MLFRSDGVPISIEEKQEPFIYNGTTYLPVRAVGEVFGKNVSWDGNTKTVYIGENPNQKNYLMTVCPPYESKKISIDDTFKIAGKTYANGFAIGLSGEALFNLDGKYSIMEFDLGKIDESGDSDLKLKIYLDGNLTEIIEMKTQELPKHFSIPLNNALQLKVEAEIEASWTKYGLVNIEVR